jgi:hypothetical protein
MHDDPNQRRVLLTTSPERVGRLAKTLPCMLNAEILRLSQEAGQIRYQPPLSPAALFSIRYSCGCVPALRGLCRDLSRIMDLEVRFASNGNSLHTISSEVSLCLFRVTQEIVDERCGNLAVHRRQRYT